MERKDIRFGGVSNVPDDGSIDDGLLSLSVNAINKDGSIQPVKDGKAVLDDNNQPIEIAADERLMYIHHLPDSGEERLIVLGLTEEEPDSGDSGDDSGEGGEGGEGGDDTPEGYVDLGLPSGTLWATCNVGASAPEEAGDYFAWGETEPKANYAWSEYEFGNYDALSKYNSVDGKDELETEDDAATANLGANARTPNVDQINELLDNTTITLEEQNGVYGALVTGGNGNSIFIPAAGNMDGDSIDLVNSVCLWARNLLVEGTDAYKCGCGFRVYENESNEVVAETGHYSRNVGRPIRPVYVTPPTPRPKRREAASGEKTFTILDGFYSVELIGSLDEGRTMTFELTYNDGVKETVSVRFTKESSYALPTYYNGYPRAIASVRFISYDDKNADITPIFVIKQDVEEPLYEELELGELYHEEEIEGEIHPYYQSGLIGHMDADAFVDSNGQPKQGRQQVKQEVLEELMNSSANKKLSISWFNKSDSTRKVICKLTTGIREITSVKNVLIISTDAGLYFARNIGQDYQYLGMLPELPCVTPYISQKWVKASSYPELGIDPIIDVYGWEIDNGTKYTISGSHKGVLWSKVSAMLGAMRKGIWKKCHFMSPFYVRIAYRMFDGTYISVSRPYPMCPSSIFQPLVLLLKTGDTGLSSEGNHDYYNIEIIASESSLSISAKGSIPEEWKEIITGIDIFISPEVYDYTADETGDTLDWLYITDEQNIAEDTDIVIQGSIPLFINPSNRDGVSISYSNAIIGNNGATDMVQQYLQRSLSSSSYVAVARPQNYPSIIFVDGDTRAYNVDEYGFYTFYVLPDTARGNVTFKAVADQYDGYDFASITSHYREYEYYNQLIEKLNEGEGHASDYYIISGAKTPIKDDGTYKNPIRLAYFQVGIQCEMYVYRVFIDNRVEVNNPKGIIHLHRTTGDTAQKEFCKQGTFYKIDSINFKDFKEIDGYTPQMGDTDIEMLTSKPPLDLSVINRYAFNCNDIYAYNNRLNVVVDNQWLEIPDYSDNLYMGVDEGVTRQQADIKYAVEVVKEGITRIVPVPQKSANSTYDNALRYFFYPNQNATRLFELKVDEDTHTETINAYNLTQHETIAGTYAFNDWELLEPSNTYTRTIENNETTVSGMSSEEFDALVDKINNGYQQEFHVGNKILQSDIENPFAFLNRGVVQLGCETIKRICATSRPVSEGQAGEHPLYAFTEEGIFALGVNADGSYSIVTHLSPEVLTGDDVTQVEQNIVFSTSKGLMNLVGGDIVCLSSKIEGHNHAEDTYDNEGTIQYAVDRINVVKEKAGLKYVDGINVHAKDWFTQANMLYDPKHNLLYLFHEQDQDAEGKYATNLGLVYDIVNGAWGMYENRLMYGVNSYTDALAVKLKPELDSQGKDTGRSNGVGVLVNMSDPYMCGEKMYQSLILTRPMEFGYSDIYKTLEDVLLRGAQGTACGMLVVWASNDLDHWKIIGSSQNYKWRNYSGTPYKYFRIGVLVNEWKEGDALTGFSVDITPRLTNKQR